MAYDMWYKTIVGTPDPAQEVQGYIACVVPVVSTVNFTIELEGVIAFRGAVDAGSTPALRREALFKLEFQRIQRVLSEGVKLGFAPSAVSPPREAPYLGAMFGKT
jgi:hypothetical protein